MVFVLSLQSIDHLSHFIEDTRRRLREFGPVQERRRPIPFEGGMIGGEQPQIDVPVLLLRVLGPTRGEEATDFNDLLALGALDLSLQNLRNERFGIAGLLGQLVSGPPTSIQSLFEPNGRRKHKTPSPLEYTTLT